MDVEDRFRHLFVCIHQKTIIRVRCTQLLDYTFNVERMLFQVRQRCPKKLHEIFI